MARGHIAQISPLSGSTPKLAMGEEASTAMVAEDSTEVVIIEEEGNPCPSCKCHRVSCQWG